MRTLSTPALVSGVAYSPNRAAIKALAPAVWFEGGLDRLHDLPDLMTGRKYRAIRARPRQRFTGASKRTYLDSVANNTYGAGLRSVDGASEITSSTQYAVAAVVRVPTAYLNHSGALIGIGDAAVTNNPIVRVQTTGEVNLIIPLGNSVRSASGYALPLNTWTAIVASVDTVPTTKEARIIIDGVDQTRTGTGTLNMTLNTANSGWDKLLVGKAGGSNTDVPWTGEMACLMFFNKSIHKTNSGADLTTVNAYLAELVAALNAT